MSGVWLMICQVGMHAIKDFFCYWWHLSVGFLSFLLEYYLYASKLSVNRMMRLRCTVLLQGTTLSVFSYWSPGELTSTSLIRYTYIQSLSAAFLCFCPFNMWSLRHSVCELTSIYAYTLTYAYIHVCMHRWRHSPTGFHWLLIEPLLLFIKCCFLQVVSKN